MYFDWRGTLISEKDPVGDPGRLGDSAANTSRYVVKTDSPVHGAILQHFFTDQGEVRHPELDGFVDAKGESWGVDDFSVDQWLPLWVACSLFQPVLRERMFRRLCRRVLRIGDGSFINAMILASIKRTYKKQNWFYDLAFLGHAYISKLPFRWSDSSHSFESSKESSADYLNWFIAGPLFAHRTNSFTWTMKRSLKVISKERIKERVAHYCDSEPNSAWLLSLYDSVIDEVYKSHSGTN